MKVILQDSSRYVLRFDKDEEVLEGIKKFMEEQAVSACVFFGIGACSSVELGYFNMHLKDYRKKPYIDDMEIISFTGNGGLADDQIVLHAHGSFGNNTFSVIGGHVFKLVVSVTCEIFLIKLDGALERKNNPDFNLNLLV
jgi:uncharacterized protein